MTITESAMQRRHRAFATLADNDNEPQGARGRAMAALLGLPMISTAAIAACLRFLL